VQAIIFSQTKLENEDMRDAYLIGALGGQRKTKSHHRMSPLFRVPPNPVKVISTSDR